MNTKIMSTILQHKIVAISRNISLEKIIPTVQAAYDGGIRLLEITFNQSDSDSFNTTIQSIEKVRQHFDGKLCVGAGTVMTLKQLHFSCAAGAEFILAPNTDKSIIEASVSKGLFCIPGALTPSEISDAYSYGADIVKVFPAVDLGPNYIKNIRGPINHIPLMAVGGIDTANMISYFQAGCMSVGIGGNILNPKIINQNNFGEITSLAETYVRIISDNFKEAYNG